MKKLKIFQIGLVLIFLLFIIFLFSAKNYTKEYKVGEINVSESYDKENKAYYFTFNYNNITLDYLIESKYKQHRTLIEDIEIIKDDNNFCIIPKSSKFTYESLCYQNEIITHYTNVNKTLKETYKEFVARIIPIAIAIITFCFIKWIPISGFGMIMFWGLFVHVIYSFIITRTLYVD